MKIIIAIDLLEGRCVRLTKGDYDSGRIYSSDPLEVALRIGDAGISHLHLVDLDGARTNRITSLKILEKIARNTELLIDFSGGIRSEEDLSAVFSAGACQVSCGSIAARQREVFLGWVMKFGPEKIILGADSRNRLVSTTGWTEDSGIDIVKYIKEYNTAGIKHVICTDIEKDGMLQGPSTALYSEILAETSINLIASGGISSMEDIAELSAVGCGGVIIGKAVYEGRISLEELGKLCSKEE